MTVVLRIFRWSDDEPERYDEFHVDAGPTTTVLDALVAVQQRDDSTLAFRYACRVGMCGSCAMVVNGRERWACRTRLALLGGDRVTLRPLYHFPLLRDLVVDMAPFVEKMRAVGGAFVPGPAPETHARIAGDGGERRAIDAAIECIGCGMCLSACTLVGHDVRFAGPAALNRAYTLALDSRDAGGDRRWPVLLADDGLARCHGQGNCTAVCPMNLEPSRSIARLRRRALARLLRPLAGLAALGLAALPSPAGAQTPAPPDVYVVPATVPPAAWALPATPPVAERHATIVAALPTPHRYRVCNESSTPAALALDGQPPRILDLPARSCIDVAARSITVVQPGAGIPPRGTYQRLD
jgi:fumarate reductase iron-sulfur subunit